MKRLLHLLQPHLHLLALENALKSSQHGRVTAQYQQLSARHAFCSSPFVAMHKIRARLSQTARFCSYETSLALRKYIMLYFISGVWSVVLNPELSRKHLLVTSLSFLTSSFWMMNILKPVNCKDNKPGIRPFSQGHWILKRVISCDSRSFISDRQ